MAGALNMKTKMNIFEEEPWTEVWGMNKKCTHWIGWFQVVRQLKEQEYQIQKEFRMHEQLLEILQEFTRLVTK